MKHKRLTVLFCLASLCLMAGVLAACRQSVLTKEKIYEDGYNCEVTFDLAGGTSGTDDRARHELHQYVQSGSPIIKPGTDKNGYSGETPVKEGYTFGGYYQGTKTEVSWDDEGNATDYYITYDMTKKWDFSKDRVTGDLTLYAYWRENYSLTIRYGDNYEKTATVTVEQDEDGVAQEVTPSVAGYTVIAYFEDRATAESALEDPIAEGTFDAQRLPFPMAPTEKFSEENKTWEIYANALEGTFTVVRTKGQFQFNSNSNIYLMTDLDYANAEGEKTRAPFPSNYSGTFYGNGHKISNFTVTRSSSERNDVHLGLFNRLAATAHLESVTFEDFELSVSTSPIQASFHNSAGGLAGYAEAGATLRDVTLKGKMICDFVEQTDGETECNQDIGTKANGFVEEGYDCSGVVITDKTASGTGSDE